MAGYNGVIHYCDHCGERTNSKYCKTCVSASGRKEVDESNKKIMQENIKKGFKYETPFWDRLK